MEHDQVPSLNRSESLSTNLTGHLWRDKWTALSGPLSQAMQEGFSANFDYISGDNDGGEAMAMTTPLLASQVQGSGCRVQG